MARFAINGVVLVEYLYNALGQQAIRRLTQAGDTFHVVHDADGNRLAEYDHDPFTQTSTLLREYIWLDGVPVGVVAGGALYFIRTDHIGRPVFATDWTSAKVWEGERRPGKGPGDLFSRERAEPDCPLAASMSPPAPHPTCAFPVSGSSPKAACTLLQRLCTPARAMCAGDRLRRHGLPLP